MMATSFCLLLANITIIVGSIGNSTKSESTDFYTSLFLGLGAFFGWCCNLQTLRYFEGFDTVTKTFSYAAWDTFLFGIGIIPIFLAFLFSGFCMFHEAERMSTLEASFETLMALFAGDELSDLFFDTDEFPLSSLYAYLYTMLMLFFIANVFVYIIEGSIDKVNSEVRELHRKKNLDKEEQEGEDLKEKIRENAQVFRKTRRGNFLEKQDYSNILGIKLNTDSFLKTSRVLSAKLQALNNMEAKMKLSVPKEESQGYDLAITKIDMACESFFQYEQIYMDILSYKFSKSATIINSNLYFRGRICSWRNERQNGINNLDDQSKVVEYV